MSDQLADFTEAINSGATPDLPPSRTALWDVAENVVFDREGPRPIYGVKELVEASDESPVRGMIQTRISGTPTQYWATPNKLYKFQEGDSSPTDVSKTGGYTGASDKLWSFASWGDWMLATNGVDAPQIDKNDGTGFGDLSGFTGEYGTAEVLVPFKTYMLAFYVNGNATQVAWSDYDDVETWTPAVYNQAGSLTIRDAPSAITAAQLHPEGVAFFTDNSLHIMSYVGPPHFFGARKMATGVGAINKHSTVTVGGAIYGIGQRGIWAVNGTEFQYIDSPHIHNYIFNDLNYDQIGKVTAWYDASQFVIGFSYPGPIEQEPNRSVIVQQYTGGWSTLKFGFTASCSCASTPEAAFSAPTAGGSEGNVYLLGQATGTYPREAAPEKSYIPMADSLEIAIGYGEFGYGELGYGGLTYGY